MENVRILLCCGAGMSSGFLAQKARQAAKKQNIHATIDARSESEVASFMGQIDILLIGPHYAGQLDKFKQMAEPFKVAVSVIPKDIYSLLDGKALLELALKLKQ